MTVHDVGPMTPGLSLVTLDVDQPGDLVWRPSLSVNGTAAAEVDDCVSLFAMAPFEGIDVGIDRRSPVSWDLYERHGPFPYSGTIAAVTYIPGELAPDAGDRFIDMLREAGTRYE
ncbi:MAG: hypothetical protein GY773_07715 [Actinomycetia bacterium]|nr:hypothetical protein [Actinomycetes bacterium]